MVLSVCRLCILHRFRQARLVALVAQPARGDTGLGGALAIQTVRCRAPAIQFRSVPSRSMEGRGLLYDDFNDERKGMAVAGHAVFQSASDPNDVTVWCTSGRLVGLA